MIGWMMNFKLKAIISCLLLTSCSSLPIIPEGSDVNVSRKAPKGNCQSLGTLTGSSLSVKATKEEVLEDLKTNAANKGATHLKVEQFSALGTSVTGTAFRCK